MIFTFEQARKYFEYRLPEEKVPARDSFTARCPFHPDRTASLSVKLSEAVWMCHAGCGSGGILDFERTMFPGGNLDSWWETITKICGLEPNKRGQRNLGTLVATYDYTGPDGKLLFQKLRYEPKNFIQRAPNGKGGWEYRLGSIGKPLYLLPRLLVSSVVMVAEGEKDADALIALDWPSLSNGKSFPPVCATCNFDGAGPGKWQDRYALFFAGKAAVIFPDNDEVGKAHAQEVAQSVSRYAHSVKVVEIPGLAEHGDVSDYLADHTVRDLAELIKKTPYWKTESSEERPFFVAPSQILKGEVAVEWLVPDLIHRGGKGLIVAAPKAGKSMIALDLGVALASCQSWLGMKCIAEPIRTGIVSREDGPGMTKRRIKQFAEGRNIPMSALDKQLRVNTYEQKRSFSVDSDADLEEIIEWLKKEEIRFCIFDVLNVLHSFDENSNTQMTQVMKRFDKIKAESGSDIAIIHHDKKDSGAGNKKPRGASAIDSWWEWKVSISPDPENERIKQVFFGSKAAPAHIPVTIEFCGVGDGIQIIPAARR